MIEQLRNINILVLVAGIGIGIFSHAMLRPPERFAAAAAAEQDTGWTIEAEDPEVLKAQLELIATENRELRADLNSARRYRSNHTVRELARSKGAKNASELIDYSKPIFRELILPELRANREQAIEDGIQEVLEGRTDRLNLSDEQLRQLKERLGQQQAAKLDELERVLNDDESSLTEYFQQQWEAERGGDPEVDDIFLEVLYQDQREAYTDLRLEENAEQVTRDTDRQLADLSRAVELDEAQQDAIFPIMARSAPGYREAMQFEGVEAVDTQPIEDDNARDAAIQSVLRPDQMDAWDDYQRRKNILGGFGVMNF